MEVETNACICFPPLLEKRLSHVKLGEVHFRDGACCAYSIERYQPTMTVACGYGNNRLWKWSPSLKATFRTVEKLGFRSPSKDALAHEAPREYYFSISDLCIAN